MRLSEFQSVVAQNARWFQGANPETPKTLLAAERAIGAALPPSLKWLLSQWGYSSACGVGSLDAAVETTLRCRRSLQLPERYILLNDWGDAGVVFFDTARVSEDGEYILYWAGAHDIAPLASLEAVGGDADVFEDFPAWVLSRLEDAIEEADTSCAA